MTGDRSPLKTGGCKAYVKLDSTLGGQEGTYLTQQWALRAQEQVRFSSVLRRA